MPEGGLPLLLLGVLGVLAVALALVVAQPEEQLVATPERTVYVYGVVAAPEGGAGVAIDPDGVADSSDSFMRRAR